SPKRGHRAMLSSAYARLDPSQLPCSRLRLTMRSTARSCRLLSVNTAGGKSAKSTSMVARPTWSCITGRAREGVNGGPPRPLLQVFVFVPGVSVRRVGCPRDANKPKVFEADLDRTVTAIERGVEGCLQARDSGTIDKTGGSPGQQGKPILRGYEVAGQEFAL